METFSFLGPPACLYSLYLFLSLLLLCLDKKTNTGSADLAPYHKNAKGESCWPLYRSCWASIVCKVRDACIFSGGGNPRFGILLVTKNLSYSSLLLTTEEIVSRHAVEGPSICPFTHCPNANTAQYQIPKLLTAR